MQHTAAHCSTRLAAGSAGSSWSSSGRLELRTNHWIILNLHSHVGATLCSSSHLHLTRWNARPNSILFWIYASSSHAELCLPTRAHRHLRFLALHPLGYLPGQRRAAMAQRRCSSVIVIITGYSRWRTHPGLSLPTSEASSFSCSAGWPLLSRLVSTRARVSGGRT